MTLLDRQLEFTGYLVAGFPDFGLRGYPLDGASSITGNGTQENLCQPVTLGAKDHGSDGIMQWRLGRLTELQTWGTKNFGDWRTLKAQAAFTIYETQRDYPALDAELRKGLEGVKSEDVRKVLDYKTERFCFEFERPNRALAGLANRQKHAASVYMIMSAEKPPVTVPKPRVPPIVTTGGVIVAGSTAAGGGVVAYQNGATEVAAIVLFGIAMVVAIAVLFLARTKKTIPTVPDKIIKQQLPLDRLTTALEQLALAKAEVAEASDALKESVQESTDLLAAAGETIPTIEHQPVLSPSPNVPGVLILGGDTPKM